MNTTNLRNNPIWKETLTIVENIHSVINFADLTDDEKYGIVSKLRYNAEDALHFVSIAVAGLDDSLDYDWQNACRHIFALEASCILATKLNVLETDPDLIVKLDNLIKKCQEEVRICKERDEERKQEELDFIIKKKKLSK